MSQPTSAGSDAATPAMTEDTPLPFSLLSVQRKNVTAAFDEGRITSDGGVLLLAGIEKQIGIADRLAPLISDPRNPLQGRQTNIASRSAEWLYDSLYCARGQPKIYPSWCVSRVIDGGRMTNAMLAAITQAFKHGYIGPNEPEPMGQHRHLAGDNNRTLDAAVEGIAGGLQPNRQSIDGPLCRITRPQPGAHR